MPKPPRNQTPPFKDTLPCRTSSISSLDSSSSPPSSDSASGSSSGSPASTSTKTKATRQQWWEPFREEILEYCVLPRLRSLLAVGVASKADLIRQWEHNYHFRPTPTMMNEWLAYGQLSDIFDAPKTFRLELPASGSPTRNMTAEEEAMLAEANAQAEDFRRNYRDAPPLPTIQETPRQTYAAPPAPQGYPARQAVDPRFTHLPPNIQKALANLSENDLRDQRLVNEAIALQQENPHMTPIVPRHIPNKHNPFNEPPRTFMGPGGPVQMPPNAMMPGNPH